MTWIGSDLWKQQFTEWEWYIRETKREVRRLKVGGGFMNVKWIELPNLPEQHKPVLITDGFYVAIAELELFTKTHIWTGFGFGGYKWEWDFEPTHWAELNINLPKKRAIGG